MYSTQRGLLAIAGRNFIAKGRAEKVLVGADQDQPLFS
jgi:hypothetical protein